MTAEAPISRNREVLALLPPRFPYSVFARSIGRRPVAINAAGGSGTWMSGDVFALALNGRRCAAGAARRQRARASISGRLIEYAVALHGLGEGCRIGVLRDLEGVEAGALHKQQLVAQDLPRCTQLAAKLMALAQEPRLAVGAAVAEVGKHQSNERSSRDTERARQSCDRWTK